MGVFSKRCTAKCPIPPLAPKITIDSPFLSLNTSSRPRSAVNPTPEMTPASCNVIDSGILVTPMKKHNPEIKLDSWLENQTTQEPEDSIHLYAELTREGMRRCIGQPWLEPHVKVTDEDHGYVDMHINKNEIEFVSAFFLQLGTNAKVIQPTEVIHNICKQLHATIRHYSP